jgi:hypothetical protein
VIDSCWVLFIHSDKYGDDCRTYETEEQAWEDLHLFVTEEWFDQGIEDPCPQDPREAAHAYFVESDDSYYVGQAPYFPVVTSEPCIAG